jgi:hypothetical protein
MTNTCSIENCESPVDSLGMCGKHAQRMRRYGDPNYLTPEETRRANNRQSQLARFEEVKATTYRKQHGRHQHRVVAEQMLGRPLKPGEIVHHIDGNKHNNDPSNLQVMTQSEHIREHFNKKNSLIEWQGKSMYPSEWAEEMGISPSVFFNRRKAGWPMERIANTPVAQRRPRRV